MPSILKIRVIKARNLLKESHENGIPVSYYSTLKLIENTELLDNLSGTSPYSNNPVKTNSLSVFSTSNSTLNSSSDSELESFTQSTQRLETNFFKRGYVERTTSPSNFTFRTKNVLSLDGSPKWDEDFRLEVYDDAQLQDTPLQLHLYKDNLSWIGSLTVDLNPLLARDSPYGICGWFPLFSDDFQNAEIFLQAKIQFFGDSNPFKESSVGVQFFCISEIPSCIKVRILFEIIKY